MIRVNWETVPEERINDYITRKMVTGDRMMLVRWRMKKGGVVPAHKHPNEQVVYMLSGAMDFRVGDKRFVCKPGDVVVIPGDVEHEGSFPEDTDVIDVFSPPREDFLKKTESYLRKG